MRVIYFDMKGIFAVNIFLNLAIPKSHSERSSSVSAEKLRISREKDIKSCLVTGKKGFRMSRKFIARKKI